MLSPFHEHGFTTFFSPSERIIVRALEDDPLADIDRCLRFVKRPSLWSKKLKHLPTTDSGKLLNSDKEFVVELNVAQFRPEELSVSVRENELVIEGHHEERDEESGKVERHFVRKYTIPENVNAESVESHLTPEGQITIKAKKLEIEQPKSRTIPIQFMPGQKRPVEGDAEAEKPAKKARKGKK